MGYCVEVYVDGKYSAVKFYMVKAHAEAYVKKLLDAGEWSDIPPRWITGEEWEKKQPKPTAEANAIVEKVIQRLRKVYETRRKENTAL